MKNNMQISRHPSTISCFQSSFSPGPFPTIPDHSQSYSPKLDHGSNGDTRGISKGNFLFKIQSLKIHPDEELVNKVNTNLYSALKIKFRRWNFPRKIVKRSESFWETFKTIPLSLKNSSTFPMRHGKRLLVNSFQILFSLLNF